MLTSAILAMVLTQVTPEPVTVTPAQFAEAIQGVVGQAYPGGFTIARIYSEGQTVVIVLDGPAGWRSTLSANEVSSLFVNSFCENRDFEYFINGNLMRVDTTERGAAGRAGPVIRACPPPPAGAQPQ